MDEMEAEDQTAIEMEKYEGSSDDEQYSLPKEWKEHVLAVMSQKTYEIRSRSTEGMR